MQHWTLWNITANIVPLFSWELDDMPNLLTEHHLALQGGHQGTFARTVYVVYNANNFPMLALLLPSLLPGNRRRCDAAA
jgi:hypothetical protein